MTAEKYQLRAQLEASQSQVNQVMALLAERMNQPAQAPAAPQLPEGIDPALKQYLDWQAQQHAEQLKRVTAQHASQLGDAQLAHATKNEHPLVAQRAQLIWQDAKQKGAVAQGFTHEQAILYARGQMWEQVIADQAKGSAAAQAANAQRAMTSGQPITNQSPPPVSGASQTKAPPDMDEDPEGAAAFYAERLGHSTF